jgi:cytochrome c oxidase subunit IV
MIHPAWKQLILLYEIAIPTVLFYLLILLPNLEGLLEKLQVFLKRFENND